MPPTIDIHTRINVDNMTPEEKQALASLKNYFDWFNGGFRDEELIIVIKLEAVSKIVLDKGSETIFEHTPTP